MHGLDTTKVAGGAYTRACGGFLRRRAEEWWPGQGKAQHQQQTQSVYTPAPPSPCLLCGSLARAGGGGACVRVAPYPAQAPQRKWDDAAPGEGWRRVRGKSSGPVVLPRLWRGCAGVNGCGGGSRGCGACVVAPARCPSPNRTRQDGVFSWGGLSPAGPDALREGWERGRRAMRAAVYGKGSLSTRRNHVHFTREA